MKKLLVTGNMGYVGSIVVRHIRESSPDSMIIGFDLGYFGNCLSNTKILPECKVDIQYISDTRNFNEEILKGVYAVIHLAAISNDPISNKFEKVTYDVNYHASIRIAKAAKKMGVKKFVFASSCSVYGLAEDEPRTESSALNPLTAYAKSKVSTEEEISKLATKDFIVTSLRFSTACGMSDRLRLDLVLNDFVACAVSSKKITILSDGAPWRPLINVKDMARAIEWAVRREAVNGGGYVVVNVGAEEWNYQVKELAETVAKVIPGVDISINKNALHDNRSYRVNFKLYKQLAPEYQPVYDLAATIRELVDGFKDMEFKDVNFRESKYIRLNMLNYLRENGLLNENLEWMFKQSKGA